LSLAVLEGLARKRPRARTPLPGCTAAAQVEELAVQVGQGLAVVAEEGRQADLVRLVKIK
jgi:hypothetical protein